MNGRSARCPNTSSRWNLDCVLFCMNLISSFRLLACVAAMASAAHAAEPVYHTKFSSPQRGFVSVGELKRDFQGWVATNNDTADSKRRKAWYWVGGTYPDGNYVVGYLHTDAKDELVWLLRDLNYGKGIEGRSSVRNPMLSVHMEMDVRKSNSDRGQVYFHVALLNNEGNGYIGEVNAIGFATLYRVNHGVTGEWTQLAEFSADREDTRQKLELKVKDGVVTFSNHAGVSVMAKDSGYGEFSTVGVSGITPGQEVLLLREVSLKED